MRKFLVTTIVILSVILVGLLGFIWFDTTHIFVDKVPYPKYADTIDLREKEVSEAHYLAVCAQLPDCEIIWNVPFQGGFQSSDTQSLNINTLAEEDIRILKAYFPGLKQVNAGACRDYSMLARLQQELPDCSVTYQVSLGDTAADPDAVEVTLEPGRFDFDVLMENLVYLPGLETVHFPRTELSLQQQSELAERYPDLTVTSTVELLGKEYSSETEILDLSSLSAADVDAAAPKLAMLTGLKEVKLSNALSLKDVQKLNLAAPDVAFQYAFEFYGNVISTMDEEVILKNVTVETDGFADELRMVLDVLENCDRFVLEARGQYDKLWKKISDEELAAIRDEYRDKTKVVWRVYFGENGSSLTDAQVLRAVYGLTDDNSKDLIYCENVRFLDIGHNEFLDYADFLSGMTDLEVAILSGAPLKSLDPIAACKNLKFLEIANCIYLPNVNALKECTQLEMLNISFTRFEDFSPINDLNLTHLTSVKNAFVSRGEPVEALQSYIDAHPECWTVYEGEQPYGIGWRYDVDEKHLPWYAKMVEAFRYPDPYNNIGWYLK